MKYLIPGYLLDALLLHYEALADAYQPDGGDTRAANAKRMAGKEISRIKRMMKKQSDDE